MYFLGQSTFALVPKGVTLLSRKPSILSVNLRSPLFNSIFLIDIYRYLNIYNTSLPNPPMADRKAQTILNELIKDLKEKNFKYEPKEEKEIDWASYNLSKIHEMEFFLVFVREAVDGTQVKFQQNDGPGRPLANAFDLAKVLLVKTYFQVGERQAEGLASLFREKLALKSSVSASSIGRAHSRTDVQEILGNVFEATSAPIRDIETSFSGDGTGLPLSTKQNYANDRDDQAKHAGYDKMAVLISNNFHIATGFIHANGTANDSPLFKPILEQTAQHFPFMNDVELDAGFISRQNCQLIAETGATPFIYPKTGITLRQDGSPAWKKMLKSLISDPQAWLRGYHPRSQSECYFSSHKRRFTRPLLRKLDDRKGVEAFCRVIGTNIAMLITAYFEHRVEVNQFNQAYY